MEMEVHLTWSRRYPRRNTRRCHLERPDHWKRMRHLPGENTRRHWGCLSRSLVGKMGFPVLPLGQVASRPSGICLFSVLGGDLPLVGWTCVGVIVPGVRF